LIPLLPAGLMRHSQVRSKSLNFSSVMMSPPFAADLLQYAVLDSPTFGRHRGLFVTAPAFGGLAVEQEFPAGLLFGVGELIGFGGPRGERQQQNDNAKRVSKPECQKGFHRASIRLFRMHWTMNRIFISR